MSIIKIQSRFTITLLAPTHGPLAVDKTKPNCSRFPFALRFKKYLALIEAGEKLSFSTIFEFRLLFLRDFYKDAISL